MKTKLNLTILAALLFTVSGCGLLGDKGVANEQIDADIGDKTVKIQEGDGTEWFFKGRFVAMFCR